MIEHIGTKSPRRVHVAWRWFVSGITILVMLFGGQAASLKVVKAASSTINLSVVDAKTGDPIDNFKYIINVDNTGTTTQRSDATLPGGDCSPVLTDGVTANTAYPDSCNWVSIAGRANHSPIYTQGTQADFPSGVFTIDGFTVNMPTDRYLISVLADGYKIDGEHFEVKNDGSDVTMTVKMQPYDLPTATIQSAVFEDMAPTNSAPDLPAERGLAGFQAHINDYIDEVTTDVFGNPLGAEYDGNGEYIPGTGGAVLSKCYVVANGEDVGWIEPVNNTGECPLDFIHLQTDANGDIIGDPLVVTDYTQMYDIQYPHAKVGIPAGAVIEGKVIIPNVGPNRYALAVSPPNKSGWVQTTTLEGNHDWDAWVMEGATGLDTEFVVAGEPFPATFFGFVPPSVNTMTGGTGTITGTGLAVSAYIPPMGGIAAGEGVLGAKPKNPNPVHRLFVSLSDLNAGDQTVFVKEFPCDETAGCPAPDFTIPNVPAGSYVLGVWDEPQDYIFAVQNIVVGNGAVVDAGDISLLGWWTTFDGYVFNDTNGDGIKQDTEPGIANFPIVMRTRENSIMDRGTVAVSTDANGYYWMESAYPMTQWLVMEAYADGFHTTGITYQADNQTEPTTVLGAGVDINVHPVIGLGGRVDWGVQAYDPGTNGGIVGTVSYDVTRNELNPAYAAIEDWQPSISDLYVDLYAPVDCGTHPNTPCDAAGQYELAKDGSYAIGPLLNQYLTETWERPSGCVARDLNGIPLVHGVDEFVLPHPADAPCIEAPMQGVQVAPMDSDQGTPNANFGASVDGNYGFGDGCYLDDGVTPGLFDPNIQDCAIGTLQALPSNKDYLVRVDVPDDAFGRPLYQVTREEDINVANGDSFVPQVPPSSCAGALHTVDLMGVGTDNYSSVSGAGYDVNGLPVGVTVSASSPVDNAPFLDMGGSVYEGQQKPLCDMKIIHLGDRKSIAPGFNFFTDVPLPGRFWGLIVDDLNWSSNPKQTGYGEKMGIPFAPVGIYDYTNRLITTVESDYNGLWDVLLPSTNRISCPTPSGVCANLYRTVGNDPGTPGHWNANYNPQYRTISAEFEAFAGLTIPADLAPTQVAVSIQLPGTQTLTPISCALNDVTGNTPATNPEFFAIDRPWMAPGDVNRTFTISGLAFGSSAGVVQLDNFTMSISSWSDNSITFTIPSSGPNVPSTGTHQLKITTANGKGTINALTFHVVPGSVSVFEVSNDPGNVKPYTSIQTAIDAAASQGTYRNSLVVVYPAAVDNNNPRYNGRGAYYENPIMYAPVQLQGVGPGGVRPDGTIVNGSMIDGIAFGGDTQLAADWLTKVGNLTWGGNQNINDGQVIYVLAADTNNTRPTLTQAGTFNSTSFSPMIDGFNIRGGDQQGLPPNLPEVFGQLPDAIGAQVETQGGAIFANSYVRTLRITNNVIESNGGSYGAIRIGTPNIGDQQNDNIRIANNRILSNGGTNLAGAIGLFTGTQNYEIANNDFCGNFSAEYGGAISHYGLSPNGSIHDNRIYFNRSYDEGAGIMIAGELPPQGQLSDGSGPVNIYNNLIQANVADDDGGGIRFLMAGNFANHVYNNMIVNNVSTHEGGGVALDDSTNVRFYNNTVMNNVTTATALTSDGSAAPAGLSTAGNSALLQASLPVGSSLFSDPLMFNNIFWDNRAGYLNSNISNTMVFGIGAAGDNTAINNWDMGSVEPGISLSPTNSVLQTTLGTVVSGSNNQSDPQVMDGSYHIPMTFVNWRANINQTNSILVTTDLPPTLMGNYHIQNSSPALNQAANSKTVGALTVNAPTTDFDNETRPTSGKDTGADEIIFVVHLNNLTAISTNTSNTNWRAEMTITVHDSNNNPVAGVPVSGSWSSASGSGSPNCTTNNSGQCTVIRTGLSKSSIASINYTVNTLASAGFIYDSGSNETSTTVTATRLTMSPTFATSATPAGTTPWTASVTITVTDSQGNLVGGASVTGSWTIATGGGLSGSGSGNCTTNSTIGDPAYGTCTVQRTGIGDGRPSATLTVTNIAKSSGSPAVVLVSGTYTVTVNNP